jgi:hypothetical protein
MKDIYTREEGNLASPLIMSMLTIILVFAVSPVIAGSGIALAKAFADEEPQYSLCEDISDTDAYNVQIDGGIEHWSNPRQAVCTTSSTYVHDNVPYASLSAAGSYTNVGNTCSTVGESPECPWIYILPKSFTNISDMPSRFNMNATSSSTTTYTADTFADITLRINGTVVLERVGQKFTQIPNCNLPCVNGGGYMVSSMISIELNSVESRDWYDEAQECLNTCNMTMTLENIEAGTSGAAVTTCLTRTGQCSQWKFESFTVDETTAEWAIQGTAIILGFFFLATALGSTSLWNPSLKLVRQKVIDSKGKPKTKLPTSNQSTITIITGGNKQ